MTVATPLHTICESRSGCRPPRVRGDGDKIGAISKTASAEPARLPRRPWSPHGQDAAWTSEHERLAAGARVGGGGAAV